MWGVAPELAPQFAPPPSNGAVLPLHVCPGSLGPGGAAASGVGGGAANGGGGSMAGGVRPLESLAVDEVSLLLRALPGAPGVPGVWPAIWMLGNLGRATYT